MILHAQNMAFAAIYSCPATQGIFQKKSLIMLRCLSKVFMGSSLPKAQHLKFFTYPIPLPWPFTLVLFFRSFMP